jgi:hypothetical protein
MALPDVVYMVGCVMGSAVRADAPEQVLCTPADAARTLAVALAAEQALATGQTVPVPA